MRSFFTPRTLLIILLLVSLIACKPKNAQEVQDTEIDNTQNTVNNLPVEPVRQVRVIVARAGDLTATRSTSVTIEPSQDSQVSSKVNGQVEAILKREGARVSAKEAVIKLDDNNLKRQVRNAELSLQSAQISLEKARLSTNENSQQLAVEVQSADRNLEVAKKKYEEAQALFAVGGIAQVDLLALEAQFKQAQAAFLQAQDALARSQRAEGEDIALLEVQLQQAQVQLEQARQDLADASISAPFAGEVAELLIEEGESVNVGVAVFRLISVDKQLGRFSVPPQDAQSLLTQKEITFNYAGTNYFAEIVRSSSAPSGQRLVDLVAALKASESPIPAGSIAQLNYEVNLASGTLVPSAAIVSEGGQNYVFIVEEEQAKRTEISLLAEASAQAAIEGIEEGAQVIYPLPLDLRNEAKVNILNFQ